ncbi:SDR family NAD(P)-dependent oxidoreductase [Demequina sp. NBRC 110054]|uniref:SDR family NAD(P)-dependent oxidoreductase n=1 Tax=Demequina sp. NBRC 110054 TaxID=1570343 RepID=UPI000A047667|nr:SDR family NAD(P)-dependent oxidoreductase [Demequina sp. NBRC 110054]
MRFQDAVVIVTGGGSGLGRAAVLRYAKEGAKVVVADIGEERAQAVADEVVAAGGTAMAVAVDIADEPSVAAMVDRTVEEYGKLDVMYANAGIPEPGFGFVPLEDMDLEAWNRNIAVNLTGAFLSTKHAVRVMKPAGKGSVVICSSAAGLTAYPGWTGYTAAKHGVNGFVKAAALSAGRLGIRVNAVCPAHGMSTGFITGESSKDSHEQAAGGWDKNATEIPLKLDRAPNLDDTVGLVLFLSSDDAAYMTGVSIAATDGGTLGKVALTVPSHIDQAQA